MKRILFYAFIVGALLMVHTTAYADETVTVTATNSDISQDLDLKMVATLFAQAKDLEEFEKVLNNPDSAYSNLDLNGDGDVDYLRVIETADQNRHLVVIQAVLAKDIYQDVASIFVDKDPETESITVQIIGDEYIYGANYIIEPVYIYRPYIYDWFWGPSWVAWHSPYYWDYWPGWWHPYHCIAHHMYWEHMYWHHHHHPYCSYRTAYHHHPHYANMHRPVSRVDYATRHPERSFAARNASTRMTNARELDRTRQTAMRAAAGATRAEASRTANTRISAASTRNATFGSSNVRTATTTNRATATTSRASATTSRTATATRGSATAAPSRTATTVTRGSATATPSRSATMNTSRTTSNSSVMRSSNSSAVRSSGTTAPRTSSSSAVRSSSSYSPSRSSAGYSSGGSMRSSSSSSSSRGASSGARR